MQSLDTLPAMMGTEEDDPDIGGTRTAVASQSNSTSRWLPASFSRRLRDHLQRRPSAAGSDGDEAPAIDQLPPQAPAVSRPIRIQSQHLTVSTSFATDAEKCFPPTELPLSEHAPRHSAATTGAAPLPPSPLLSTCPSLDSVDSRPAELMSSASSIHSVLSFNASVCESLTAVAAAVADDTQPSERYSLPIMPIPEHAVLPCATLSAETPMVVTTTPASPPHSANARTSSVSASSAPSSAADNAELPFIATRYTPIRKLGSGSFASVWLAHDRHQPGLQVAVKVVQKRAEQPADTGAVAANVERARRETRLLRSLDHPNIVRVLDEFENASVYCLVLEYADAGDLYDWVTRLHQGEDARGADYERTVQDLFGQLLHAVDFIHQRGIIHRDIKLENVLLVRAPVTVHQPSGLRVLLADFGLAVQQLPSEQYVLAAGSDEYAAPEVVMCGATEAGGAFSAPAASNAPNSTGGGITFATGNDHRAKIDVWSLGVILYALLYGRLPFMRKAGQTRRSFLYRIARGDVSFPRDASVSVQAASVARALLQRKPDERASTRSALQMPWTTAYIPSH